MPAVLEYYCYVGSCDCASFTDRGTCRHEKALRRYLGVDQGAPTYAAWIEQRARLAH
jgi:hypothetical protein